MTGTPVLMAEREEPDLDRVRRAMREHDERQDEAAEEQPPEPAPSEEPPEDGEDE